MFIGLILIIGFIISIVVILTKQQRMKFIFALLKLAKICFWDNSYIFIVSIIMSVISIVVMHYNLVFISWSLRQKDLQVVYDKPFLFLMLFEILWTHGFTQAYSDFLYQAIPVFWYFN